MTPPPKSRRVPPRPQGSRLVLGAALITCVSLVGTAWGFLSGGLLLVAIVCIYMLVTYERSARTENLLLHLVDAQEELNDVELGILSDDAPSDAARAVPRAVHTGDSRDRQGELLAGVSHAVRTPMTGIVGMADLLLDSNLDEDQQDWVRTIKTSARSLLTVIDELLDVSRAEAGQLRIEARRFELRECLHDAVELLLADAASKGLDLDYVVDPAVPSWLVGDATRINQIVVNLLGNAVKFTERGSVELAVHALEHDERTCVLHFEVRDTGIGLAEGERERVFQPFAQGDSPAGRRTEGVGLGLALCRKLVELMEGRIGVETRAGIGSIFWFDVPFDLAIDQGAGDSAEASAVAGKRLLVVAHSAATRRTVRTYGDGWGARVDEVDGAVRATRLVKRAAAAGRGYDAVVVDARLQDGSAAELAAELRRDQSLRDLRFVLLTDRGGQERPAELARLGFDAWLSKPVAPRRLLGALAHALDGAPVGNLTLPRSRAARRQRITLDVIVIDDNLVQRDVLTNLLATAGIPVKNAGDAKTALDLLKRNAFGLALVDPSMKGFEPRGILAAIRTIVERDCSELPVVALGAAGEGERYDGYLAKPVRKGDLARLLEQWLGEPVPSLADAASESHEMNDDSNNVLDPDVIATLKELGGDDDPDLFAELVELFLEDTPTRLEALSKALEQGDPVALEQAAHALKSSAGNLGARFLAELFRDIEAAGRDKALERAQPLVARSNMEFGKVRDALRAQVG